MVRPPVATEMLLTLYTFSCACTIALDALSNGVKITDQRVPGAVLNGTEYVVLDCVYKVKPDETEGLVVTWYFNNSPSPTYQWIPGQPPRTIGPLRSRINLGYAAPTDDALAKYRALYIIRPTIELSGDYKCVVSTYTDEDFMIKKMTVYAPGQHMHMKRTKTENQEMVNISCTVSRVFPMPNMQLYKLNTNGTENRNSTLPIDILDYQNDGAYDVTVSSLFSESELPSRTIFFCKLIIPNTPYSITKRFVYNPGNTESLSAGKDTF
uniref:Ig-like domain-containing protein n=1 Tax=Sipha flava TaxID=143950 RepID=A0A2S2Q2N4_9HEMI